MPEALDFNCHINPPGLGCRPFQVFFRRFMDSPESVLVGDPSESASMLFLDAVARKNTLVSGEDDSLLRRDLANLMGSLGLCYAFDKYGVPLLRDSGEDPSEGGCSVLDQMAADTSTRLDRRPDNGGFDQSLPVGDR